MPTDLVAEKAALRTRMRALRAGLSPRERASAAEAISRHILEHALVRPGSVVGAFMPIGEEINPLPLCTRLRAAGHAIALPRMVGKGRPVEFRLHEPGDRLDTAVWGIREPLPTAPLVVPDTFLVPLLAFDDHGHRLGYGGGFYDRTLRAARTVKTILTIGIAYDAQRVDAVPVADYDEILDWIVTPSGPHGPFRRPIA
ncbi:MAG TPA: 5-formyltetrahydrofolate cyclo-ligase [Hyphomicrobiaceae bacterium]|nr:5-formyltetrahydrofolate cyclo-ligase [Hyphomicrobiaceae bacterium]